MSRHPWRSRAALMVIITSLGTIAATLGLATDTVDEAVGVIGLVLALAVDLGILRDGERETTPVGQPLGADLLPMMPLRDWDDLVDAANEGDLALIRALLPTRSH